MRIIPNAVQPPAVAGTAVRREAPPATAGVPGGGPAPAEGKPLPERPAGAGMSGPDGAASPEGSGTEEAVRRIQAYVQAVRRELRFSVDETTGRTVIQVLDPATDRIIRQIPPEEVIAIARALAEGPRERVEGLLFRARA